jgi:hypothetical protein
MGPDQMIRQRGSVRNLTFYYPVNRQIQHQTVAYCLTEAGDAHSPLLVSEGHAVKQIFERTICKGINLRIESMISLYVTNDVFEQDQYQVKVVSSPSCPARTAPTVGKQRQVELGRKATACRWRIEGSSAAVGEGQNHDVRRFRGQPPVHFRKVGDAGRISTTTSNAGPKWQQALL